MGLASVALGLSESFALVSVCVWMCIALRVCLSGICVHVGEVVMLCIHMLTTTQSAFPS